MSPRRAPVSVPILMRRSLLPLASLPQHAVEHNRGQDQEPGDRSLPRILHAPDGQVVEDHGQDRRPHQRLLDAADATTQAGTAEDDGGDHGELQPQPGSRVDDPRSRRREQTADPGEETAEDVNKDLDPGCGQSAQRRCPRIVADGVDGAPEAGLGHHRRDEEVETEHQRGADRKEEPAPGGDSREERILDVDPGIVEPENRLANSADGDQCPQRHDHRADLQELNQRAIYETDESGGPEPSERSMPPIRITKVAPMPTTPMTDIWRRMLSALSGVRK